MCIEDISSVYGIMTQTTGSLIALVGIFIIFRTQLQMQSIWHSEETIAIICKRFKDKYKDKTIDCLANNIVQGTIEADSWEIERLSEQLENKIHNKKILKYTIDHGKGIVRYNSLMFIYYFILLHLNTLIKYNIWQVFYFCFGLVFSGFLIIWILFFIPNSIKIEKQVYLPDWLYKTISCIFINPFKVKKWFFVRVFRGLIKTLNRPIF